MSDFLRRIDLNGLYPPFRARIETLVANCSARGHDYYAVSGLRTVDEQNRLYAQGRTTPGPVVTNARGGQSYHNFGVAVDFCLDKDRTRDGLQPDWDVAAYEVLAEEAEKLGLEPGLRWKFRDAPHIQLRIGSAGLGLKDFQDAYARTGYAGVRALLDRFRW